MLRFSYWIHCWKYCWLYTIWSLTIAQFSVPKLFVSLRIVGIALVYICMSKISLLYVRTVQVKLRFFPNPKRVEMICESALASRRKWSDPEAKIRTRHRLLFGDMLRKMEIFRNRRATINELSQNMEQSKCRMRSKPEESWPLISARVLNFVACFARSFRNEPSDLNFQVLLITSWKSKCTLQSRRRQVSENGSSNTRRGSSTFSRLQQAVQLGTMRLSKFQGYTALLF